MSDNLDNDILFKIGIIGPSRVGKTSFITAVLENAQTILAGTPISIKANGLPTSKRIEQHKNERQGSVNAKEFNPGGLRGTEEKFIFEFILDAGFDRLNIGFMDYPGAWIDAAKRTEITDKRWQEECLPWIKESTVLVIPTDAAVIMEAYRPSYRKAVPFILTIGQIGEVAREWAKSRAERIEEPALLIISPLKCEAYFNDNGGYTDKSKELYGECRQLYEIVKKAVKEECSHAQILYAPIDTFGCVEYMNGEWKENKELIGNMEFSAKYRVRYPPNIKAVGADIILICICKQFIEILKRFKERKKNGLQKFAEEDRGLFGNIWMFITGERSRRKGNVKQLEEKLEKFQKILDELAKRGYGRRVEEDI